MTAEPAKAPTLSRVRQAVEEHVRAVQGFFATYEKPLEALAHHLATGFGQNHTLYVCGNGGSACDALHIAGEFVGRFSKERRALPAIALSADPGVLTAVGNDYGFERVFSRQIEAHGRKGDVLIALSTSGSSPNVLKALETARAKELLTVLFTGERGRDKKSAADYVFVVPSAVTAHIQEVHIMALQLLVALVEEAMFG